ncbi:MAG: PKD domain-containing protein [Chloroflexota bacterium]
MAEFAIVLPVMLLIGLVGVDFGRIYFTTIQAANAAREAADYGAEYPSDNAGMIARANAERNAQSQAGQPGSLTYPQNMDTTCASPGGTSMSCADAPGGGGAGNTLTVKLTLPFTFLTPLISNFFGGSLSITSSATVVVLGQAGDPEDPNPDNCDGPSTPMLTVTSSGLVAVIDPAGSLPDSGVCAISGYNYDFGDGETGVGGTVPTSHTYSSAGTYTVELTVTNQGGSATATRTLTVPSAGASAAPTATAGASSTPGAGPTPTPSPTPAPSASQSPSPTGAPTPTPFVCGSATPAFTYVGSSHGSTGQADFTDQSTYATGCPITTWLWDFGDGTPLSNAQNPSHDFDNKNGTYTVTLTVTNFAGSSSISKSVHPK